MSEGSPTASYSAYPPTPPTVFGTRIPSGVTFSIAVLLFLLPFAELRCKAPKNKEQGLFNLSKLSTTLTNTGWGLATGSDWKINMPSLGGFLNYNDQKEEWKKQMEPQKPNYYAMVALALAILGLGLSFTTNKAWIAVSVVAGALSAISLIGLMFDLIDKSKDLVTETQRAGNSFIEEGTGFKLTFTPWFYIAVIALLVSSFFSYLRMRSLKRSAG